MDEPKPSLGELIRFLRESIPTIVNRVRTALPKDHREQLNNFRFYANRYRRAATEARIQFLVERIDPQPLKDFMDVDSNPTHPEFEKRLSAVMKFLYDSMIEVEALERKRQAGGPDKTKITDAAPVTPPPDGPTRPNGFQWQGKRNDLEPIPWNLLNFLWTHRIVSEADAIDAVWGHDSPASERDGPLKSALRKINQALDEMCCPLHASRKAGYITLS